MLQNLLNMGVYLYTTVGIGVLGFLILSVMNSVFRRNLHNKDTYQKAVHRINTVTTVSTVTVLVVTAVALGTGYGVGGIGNREIMHLAVGLGTSILLICYGKYLAFSDREQLLGDYLFRLIDQQDNLLAEQAPEPPTKEQLVEQALRGIRESAAAGENKFAHLLSQEEEAVMREVINVFITQG